MTKRVKKKKPQSAWVVRLLIASVVLLLIGISSIVSYKKGHADGEAAVKATQLKAKQKQEKLLAQISEAATPKKDLVGRLQDVLREQKHTEVDPQHEFDHNRLGRPPQGPKREVKKKKIYSHFKKPKLAIIMDDVSFSHDVQSIKSLNMPITMSFLPPSPAHPDSAKLANKEKIYMVHLPLEAMSFSAEEPITLRVGDSKQIIEERVNEVTTLFPRVYYVNNHTGSRFTSDKTSVMNLITALNKKGIGFLDSRTTAETKVPEVMASLGKPYIARDLFLDHEADVGYIETQIQKAIKKAKEHGSAIAIGHPRKETLKALKNSRHALESVELVYINKVI